MSRAAKQQAFQVQNLSGQLMLPKDRRADNKIIRVNPNPLLGFGLTRIIKEWVRRGLL